MTDSQVMTEKDNSVTLVVLALCLCVALALCLGFVIGYASCQYINWKELHTKSLTWEQTIASMLDDMKRDIAIKWCYANKEICRAARNTSVMDSKGE